MKSTHAKAAAMIRKELKTNGINATVRSKSYAGGSSITVSVNQDITPAAKREIEFYCGQFEQGHFDGMTDCYEYSNCRDDLPQVKFVFVNVNYSDEMKAAARAFIDGINGIDEYEKDRYVTQALYSNWGDFWSDHKPRVKAA